MINEEFIENQALAWFEQTGWEVFHGKDLLPEGMNPQRTELSAVVLEPIFHNQLKKLNPHLPISCFDEVLATLKKAQSRDLVEANHAFHRFLIQGVPVSYRQDDKQIHETAFLVDFNEPKRNAFWVVNQFEVRGNTLRRPDIVCFVNGLPLAVIELKNPANEQTDIWHAFHQLQTYKNDIFDLLMFNESLVISDGMVAKVGSLTADEERFMPWKTIKNEHDKPVFEWQLEVMIKCFFLPELFCDYLRFFILFERRKKPLNQKTSRVSSVPCGARGGKGDIDCLSTFA